MKNRIFALSKAWQTFFVQKCFMPFSTFQFLTPDHLDYQYPDQTSEIFAAPMTMTMTHGSMDNNDEMLKIKANEADNYQTMFNHTPIAEVTVSTVTRTP